MLGKIEARYANPIVGHAVVDVETVWCAEVVAAVDAGGKDNVGNRSLAFLRKQSASTPAAPSDRGSPEGAPSTKASSPLNSRDDVQRSSAVRPR
jgi:hypothetical protein